MAEATKIGEVTPASEKITTDPHILNDLRHVFEESGLGTTSLATQPDGDLDLYVALNRDSVETFFKEAQDILMKDMTQNGHDISSEMAEKAIESMKKALDHACSKQDGMVISNPAGKLAGVLANDIATLLYGQQSIDNISASEETVRHQAESAGSSYIESAKITCVDKPGM